MSRPEYEVTHAVLRYAARCLQEGNPHALREMGFGASECNAVSSLTLTDLAALERRLTGHILQVRLDKKLFWLALADLKREASNLELQKELTLRDAPAEMMKELFRISEKEYTRLRQFHEVQTGVGRPLELDPDASWALSEALEGNDQPMSPAEWLRISEETKIPLRACWREIKRWQTPVQYSDDLAGVGKKKAG